MKKYIAVKLLIPEENQDSFIGIISDLELTGVEQHNDYLTINFPATYYNEEIENELSDIIRNSIHNIEIIDITEIDEKNWNEDWEKTLEPVFIDNRLVITPRAKAIQFQNYEFVIKIDPQMSFGTGYHATTRLASKLLMSSVNEGEKWIDAGTGTGILAILASKIGAKEVVGFDIDEWSVNNSKENVDINGTYNVEILLGDLNKMHFENYDGIVANIFSNVLIDNMENFSNSILSGGALICTGILKYDKLKVLDSAESKGFALETELSEDEWIAYKFRKIK